MLLTRAQHLLLFTLVLAVIFHTTHSAQTARRRLWRSSAAAAVGGVPMTRGAQGTHAWGSRAKARPQHRGLSPRAGSDGGYKIFCYYTNWSQYRKGVGKFLPKDVDPHLCTHIIFAFGDLKGGKLASYDENDEMKPGSLGLYNGINSLKKANPTLKTLLSVGPFGTEKFPEMAAGTDSRKTYASSAVSFLRAQKFDGLDIDWEFPSGERDKQNLVLLLKELKEAFEAEAQRTKNPRLLLTAAVAVGPKKVRGGYDVPGISKYLDFINVMAYNFHAQWEQNTGHNSPLYAPSSDTAYQKQLSVDNAASLWVSLGAPKDKLIIGLATYGRTFTLRDPSNYEVNAPTNGAGKAGRYTAQNGLLAYYEVCEMLKNGASYIWDDEMNVPYAVMGDQWVGFDDERSIRNKMSWLKEKGYAGTMIWTLDMDDFSGTVCGGGVKYPLVGAMREELLGVKRGGDGQDVDWSRGTGTAPLPTNSPWKPITPYPPNDIPKATRAPDRNGRFWWLESGVWRNRTSSGSRKPWWLESGVWRDSPLLSSFQGDNFLSADVPCPPQHQQPVPF